MGLALMIRISRVEIGYAFPEAELSMGDFLDLITLFTVKVGCQKAVRRSLKCRIRAVQNGQTVRHVIEDEEVRLMQNLRRRAA